MRETTFQTVRRTSTDYIVGPAAVGKVDDILAEKACVLIADQTARDLHPAKMNVLGAQRHLLGTMSSPAGEAIKCIEYLYEILGFLESCNPPKNSAVVVMGGGTLCDVSALAATLMRRGLELILVPTTLVAQIDAAVGGKNGINFGLSKNLIGAFHQPSYVCCDQDFLMTLGHRQTICGIAEAIKVMAISTGATFSRYFSNPAWLTRISSPADWTDFVWDAVRCKLELLADDVYEDSPRRLLNYGHTFGHLLEGLSAYNLSHGEAVLIGMIVENEISRQLGIGSDTYLDSLNCTITAYLTPECSKHFTSFSEILPSLCKLQHSRCGIMNCVCVSAPGTATIVAEVPLELMELAWTRARSLVEDQGVL